METLGSSPEPPLSAAGSFMDDLKEQDITAFCIPPYTFELRSFCGIFVLSAVHYERTSTFSKPLLFHWKDYS